MARTAVHDGRLVIEFTAWERIFTWRRYEMPGMALAAILCMAALAVVVGGVTGVLGLDLAGFSGLHQVFGDGPTGEVLLRALTRAGLLFLLVLPLAFCEEWGRRGFLLPRLMRFGRWGAFGLSGVIWAVWHLPGYVGSPAWSAFVPFAAFTTVRRRVTA